MTLEERKARLVSLILSTNEDELIHKLEEDVVAYKAGNVQEATDDLSPEELAELKELMEEPLEHNTISLEEFRQQVAQWRTGSL